MQLYGLLDRQLERVVEWYTSREAAEAELAVILNDEPEWVTKLEIVRVDFGGAGLWMERGEGHPDARAVRLGPFR